MRSLIARLISEPIRGLHTGADARRLARALVASVATAAIYVLVIHVTLPGLQARLTRARVEWLRQTFAEYPTVVLGVIGAIAAVLALPVPGVFVGTYGQVTPGTSIDAAKR